MAGTFSHVPKDVTVSVLNSYWGVIPLLLSELRYMGQKQPQCNTRWQRNWETPPVPHEHQETLGHSSRSTHSGRGSRLP